MDKYKNITRQTMKRTFLSRKDGGSICVRIKKKKTQTKKKYSNKKKYYLSKRSKFN